jgi:hypothetical protein
MTAWWAVIGTLGGVVVTAVFSLANTYLNHRWADRSFAAQQQATARTTLRAIRREVYMRYLVAAQSFYDKSDKLYFKHREQPIDPEEYLKKPDPELQPVRADYEKARVDALLVADAGVRDAIEAYEDVFGELWPKAASGTDRGRDKTGTDRSLDDKSTACYDHLVDAMHAEVVDLSGGGSPSPA